MPLVSDTPAAAPAPQDPRPAATVLILRDSPRGPEILMLRRHAGAGFAADAWVFPGGVVDAADRALPRPCWRGIDPAALTEHFDAPADLVLGYHVAAVRETFEEAGLLLAHHDDGAPVDLDDASVQSQRDELNARGRAAAASFATWLQDRRVVLDLEGLTYLSRWVTPVGEARRYDACFFFARVPEGQFARHDRIETTDQRWITAAEALRASHIGEMQLMFPTVHTLKALAAATSTDEVIAAAARQATVRRLQPHLETGPQGRPRLIHPDDDDYPAHLYR